MFLENLLAPYLIDPSRLLIYLDILPNSLFSKFSIAIDLQYISDLSGIQSVISYTGSCHMLIYDASRKVLEILEDKGEAWLAGVCYAKLAKAISISFLAIILSVGVSCVCTFCSVMSSLLQWKNTLLKCE